MLKAWNDGDPSLQFFNLPATNGQNLEYQNLDSYRDSEIGIYRSDHWYFELSNNALAITQYFAIKRNAGLPNEYLELLHADIIINYRYYQFSKDPNSSIDFHLPTVILHELGHLLGLSHQNNLNIEAIMAPYLGRWEVYKHLMPNDGQRLKQNYHQDNNVAFLKGKQPSPDPFLPSSLGNQGQKESIVKGIIELKQNGQCLSY